MRNNILKQVDNKIENLLELTLKMDSQNKKLYFLTSYYCWRCFHKYIWTLQLFSWKKSKYLWELLFLLLLSIFHLSSPIFLYDNCYIIWQLFSRLLTKYTEACMHSWRGTSTKKRSFRTSIGIFLDVSIPTTGWSWSVIRALKYWKCGRLINAPLYIYFFN